VDGGGDRTDALVGAPCACRRLQFASVEIWPAPTVEDGRGFDRGLGCICMRDIVGAGEW
jgi:hypothetical protein